MPSSTTISKSAVSGRPGGQPAVIEVVELLAPRAAHALAEVEHVVGVGPVVAGRNAGHIPPPSRRSARATLSSRRPCPNSRRWPRCTSRRSWPRRWRRSRTSCCRRCRTPAWPSRRGSGGRRPCWSLCNTGWERCCPKSHTRRIRSACRRPRVEVHHAPQAAPWMCSKIFLPLRVWMYFCW